MVSSPYLIFGRAEHLLADVGYHFLQHRHDVGIVGVGFVALQEKHMSSRICTPNSSLKPRKKTQKQAAWSFDVANKVEQVHAKLFQKAIDAMKAKKDMEKVDYYVCSVCGNTVEGSPPEKCPVCGSPREKYFKPA